MLVLVRTDRPVYIVHASDPAVARGEDEWFIVDAPVPGALTLFVRPLSRREFIEAIVLGQARVKKRTEGEDLDRETLDRLNSAEIKSICARRCVVAVFGDDLPESVLKCPGAIVDMLGDPENDLGNWAMGATVLRADPFVPVASGP